MNPYEANDTLHMGLQEDYDDIYNRNITKNHKFKKASLKKELQPA